MLTYQRLAVFCAILTVTLALTLITAPQLIYMLFGVEGAPSTDFISKRAAALFLGFATLFWVSRKQPSSPARQAILAALAVSMTTLALIGSYEYLRGFAGAGILLAVFGETAIAVCAVVLWRRH